MSAAASTSTASIRCFSSAVRLGEAFSIAAMAAAVGAAAVWRERDRKRPKPQHRYPAGRARHQPGVHLSSDDQRAPLSRLDGRLASVQRVPLPDQGRTLGLSVGRSIRINTSPGAISSTAGSVTPTSPLHIARWDAQELEDAANAQGHTLCIARSPEEWLAHPQGAYLSQEPVIAVRKIGESEPER